MSKILQKRPFYSGNFNSETPGDGKPRFYIEEMLQVLQCHMKLLLFF